MKIEEAIREAVNGQRLNGNSPAAFLASLRANGWEIVPVEATGAMHDAARDWSLKRYGQPIGIEASEGCWHAMLAAAAQGETP